MRRIAVVAVLMGVSTGSLAMADPFEQLSGRLQYYQAQIENGAAAQPTPSPNAAYEGAEVVPTPMPQPADELGFYPGHGMWQEPMMVGCSNEVCCQRGGTYWGRAEYLVWWVRGANTPPLVTTSPDGTPVGEAGVLPDAQILFGNRRINTEARSGGRFTLGYWCDPCETFGIEDTFFFIGNGNDSFFANSLGTPILARPFFNTQTQAQDAVLLAFPQVVLGSINVTSNRTIASNELNLRRGLYFNSCSRFDVLAGYRFFHLGEGLDVRTNTASIEGQTVPIGTTFAIEDLFSTRSQFNGAQLGFNYQRTWGCWTLDVVGKLALGGVSQRVVIDGSTVVTVPDEEPVVNEGGILALDSNIGTFKRSRFGAMPEFGLNLRYQWSCLWTISAGYTVIGLTNVVRPGDQIDFSLDPAQFPPGEPGTFPEFAFNDSDLWLQGFNFGIECNF